jgi:hypothetical protein
MIAYPPFPINGIEDTHKYQADNLITVAEKHEPGFCQRHGVALDQGHLPSGKTKHQVTIKNLWPHMPMAAKMEFLESQFDGAFNYLLGCAVAFEKAGCEMPDEVKQAVSRLTGFSRPRD